MGKIADNVTRFVILAMCLLFFGCAHREMPKAEAPPPPPPTMTESAPPPPPPAIEPLPAPSPVPAPEPVMEPPIRYRYPAAEPPPPSPANERYVPAAVRPTNRGASRSTNTCRTQPTESPTPQGFKKGQAAYHVPLTMVENKTSNVDLWIDASVSSEELRIRLYEFLEDNAKRANKRINKNDVKSNASVKDEIVGREVLIGKKMYAELIGTSSDFEISPSGKVEATYKEGIPLRWSWLVKPKRDGEEGLPLEIKVTADPGDGQTPIETIREKVIVHAREKTWKEKLEELDWWIKLLTGGGISSIVFWLYKKFRGQAEGVTIETGNKD